LRGERRIRTHRVQTETHQKPRKMICQGARRTRIAQNAARKPAPESYDVPLNFWHATRMRRVSISVVRFFKFCAHTRMKQEAGELRKKKKNETNKAKSSGNALVVKQKRSRNKSANARKNIEGEKTAHALCGELNMLA